MLTQAAMVSKEPATTEHCLPSRSATRCDTIVPTSCKKKNGALSPQQSLIH